jgi:3-deoxy-D-manno-octulosonic-acid transferase
LTRRLFNLPASFAAQNEDYRERFLRVGVEPRRIEVLGNLKHDQEPSSSSSRGPDVRTALGWPSAETVVLVGGSTHPGEDVALLRIYDEVRRGNPALRLVLVPRHVERLADPAELGRWKAGAPLVRWSQVRGSPVPLGDSVLVVDTLGELELFYAISDISFVGGSLVPHGGHNLFEAARLSRPVLFGPHFANFREEGEQLLREEAAICVSDEKELEAQVRDLAGSREERDRLGPKAALVAGRSRGAVARHLAWIDRCLGVAGAE